MKFSIEIYQIKIIKIHNLKIGVSYFNFHFERFGIIDKDLQLQNKNCISSTFEVSHFDMSGNFFKESQPLKSFFILVIFDVFILDKPTIENNELQQEKI